MLAFLPLMSAATTYDVADLPSLNQICSNASFVVQDNGKTYSCPTEIILPAGDTIISSLAEPNVILQAHAGITLQGNNRVGSATKRISLNSLAIRLSIENSTAKAREYQDHHSVIYGDLTSSYPMSLSNVLINGDINLLGATLTTNGQYNSITGNITTLGKTTLNNTNVCGNISAEGGRFEIKTQNPLTAHFVVGDITSLHSLDIQDISVFGTATSQGQTGRLSGEFYAPEMAVNTFYPLKMQSESVVCGDIKTHGNKPDNISFYCGLDQSSCDYASQHCPVASSETPVCTMTPPGKEDDLALVLSPEDDMTLMCGDKHPTFSATTTNQGNPVSTTVNATLSHPSLFEIDMLSGKQQISPLRFISGENGELILSIRPLDITAISLEQRYTLTLTLARDSSKTQTVEFMFTPYQFEAYSPNSGEAINDIAVIAGKSEPVHVRLLACADEHQPVVATSYSGQPDTNHTLLQPQDGHGGGFSYLPKFRSGVSQTPLLTHESGRFQVKLSDSFDCSSFLACPDSGVAQVFGYFGVRSRPWTLAICEHETPLNNGSSESGGGFIAAGELFSVAVKPIVWQSEGNITGPVDIQASHCQAKVTRNFMLSDAPAASVHLTSRQHTPSQNAAMQTKLLQSHLSLQQVNTASQGNDYLFEQLYWREVGSLTLEAQLAGPYLGMPVNQGERAVGRFYPKYFEVRDQEWLYPSGQNFAYMNQPFEQVSYEVAALNANQEDLENYAYFSPSLHQHFDLGELGDYMDRFIPPTAQLQEWKHVDKASIGSFVIKNSTGTTTCANSACWIKDATSANYPDGPFNTPGPSQPSQIGLIFTTPVDPVAFFDDSQLLAEQPDIRFGRLRFSDVGGAQGKQVRVPLSVEIWQNNRFRTNVDDNTTTADGSYYIQTPIWSAASANNAYLSGQASLTAGHSQEITAKQIDAAREQIRFWLDLGQTANNLPWLKYNWDTSTAEEDNPPAVVTFGIHRGNDRIIYRGEPNLVGMN
ncbi:polymer-forming cytoskeletal protein [Vibrio sp. CAU 1672]|nr:polymer-forming cytoskeletal protein [Vibrio sp. CAU 1672]